MRHSAALDGLVEIKRFLPRLVSAVTAKERQILTSGFVLGAAVFCFAPGTFDDRQHSLVRPTQVRRPATEAGVGTSTGIPRTSASYPV